MSSDLLTLIPDISTSSSSTDLARALAFGLAFGSGGCDFALALVFVLGFTSGFTSDAAADDDDVFLVPLSLLVMRLVLCLNQT